jgi:hypothetical protein
MVRGFPTSSCVEMAVVVCADVDCTFPNLSYQLVGGGTHTNSRYKHKNVKARYATGFEKSCKYIFSS